MNFQKIPELFKYLIAFLFVVAYVIFFLYGIPFIVSTYPVAAGWLLAIAFISFVTFVFKNLIFPN